MSAAEMQSDVTHIVAIMPNKLTANTFSEVALHASSSKFFLAPVDFVYECGAVFRFLIDAAVLFLWLERANPCHHTRKAHYNSFPEARLHPLAPIFLQHLYIVFMNTEQLLDC